MCGIIAEGPFSCVEAKIRKRCSSAAQGNQTLREYAPPAMRDKRLPGLRIDAELRGPIETRFVRQHHWAGVRVRSNTSFRPALFGPRRTWQEAFLAVPPAPPLKKKKQPSASDVAHP